MTNKKNDSLVWKIAGGIIAGLLGWQMADAWIEARRQKAYAREIERVFDPKEIERRSREWFPEIEAARRQMQADAAHRAEITRSQQQHRIDAQRLQPGQRCIDGQRFQRLANGWEQVGSC